MKTSEHYLVLIIPLGIAMLELPDDDEGDWTREPSPVPNHLANGPSCPRCAQPHGQLGRSLRAKLLFLMMMMWVSTCPWVGSVMAVVGVVAVVTTVG
jgi:hypothetical protein